jgi:hypothetical protein
VIILRLKKKFKIFGGSWSVLLLLWNTQNHQQHPWRCITGSSPKPFQVTLCHWNLLPYNKLWSSKWVLWMKFSHQWINIMVKNSNSRASFYEIFSIPHLFIYSLVKIFQLQAFPNTIASNIIVMPRKETEFDIQRTGHLDIFL